ncbi:hypothetical protein QZQ97_22770 [Serratia sp. root2]|uniref:MrpH family fimbial adhesin n=1 Tax=Serratia sp. root2 TaxID=3059676 RepID=UPI00288D3143|nr:hypothetical protein [Serratia sp. root2]MDT3253742.1 hypothetical protein [Serratia sp. root2]
MKLSYIVIFLSLIGSSANAAILHICNNVATLRGTTAGSSIQTEYVYQPQFSYDGVFVRGDTATRYTSNSLSGTTGQYGCTWCTAAWMTTAMGNAMSGNGHLLPNRMTVGPVLQPREAQYREIIQVGQIWGGQMISPSIFNVMYIPITEVQGCPTECSVTADNVLDFGTIANNEIDGRKKTLPAQLQCSGDANVNIKLTSSSGTGTIQLGNNIMGKLSVSGESGEVGFNYKITGNSSIPIIPDVTLNSIGTAEPGTYSAIAILEYSVL